MENDWSKDKVIIDNGIELTYTRTGDGDKPTILLAHGLTDFRLCWHQFASDLEDKYNLIMYDAYGHGDSSRVDPGKRFDLVEDMHDLVEALKLEKPAVIGHSMGAATAACFAAKYPQMVSAIVLEDPPWSDIKPTQKQFELTMKEWKKRNLSAKEKSIKELVKLKKKESPNWEETILKEWAQAKHFMDPNFFDYYPFQERDWRKIASKITIPTLIVTGDNDRGAIVTPAIGMEAVQIMDKGEFGHISAAGHCVRYEQYQPYLRMVSLFLKRNVPA
jgi:pimeloyl-ACP methyl ester carboxylesterase